MPNSDQDANWNGAAGEHWAAEADRYDRMLAPFGDRVLAAASAQPGEAVLDVGCGNGALALALAEKVGKDGQVTGVDLSTPMLAEAQRRAHDAGRANVTFIRADAQTAALPGPFDLLVSRFGVMFFDDPKAAFANLTASLRPGGRVAFVCWQDLLVNEWIIVPAAAALEHVGMPDVGEGGSPGPFAFADASYVTGILEDAGLVGVAIDDATASMTIGKTTDDAVAYLRSTDIAAALMEGVESERAARAWDAISVALEPHTGPAGVQLLGRAWLVTARRPG